MKRTLLFLAAVALLASCSAPKYTYNFDHYNYNAGKKKAKTNAEVVANDGPQAIQPELLTASASNVVETVDVTPTTETKMAPVKKTYAQMTKTERKEIKNAFKEVKKIVKAEKKAIKEGTSTKAMDHDLKLAAIFGAVGVVGLILGGVSSVFWAIGGVALLIGVVFFVIWLTKQ